MIRRRFQSHGVNKDRRTLSPVASAVHQSEGLLTTFLHDDYRPNRLSDCGDPDRTVQDYTKALSDFELFLGHPPTFDDLDEDVVCRWLDWLKSERGLANSTLNNKRRAQVVALWNHAWRKRKVSEQPRDVTRYKPKDHPVTAWTPRQMASILATAKLLSGRFDENSRTPHSQAIPARLFWPALLSTLYDTGLRIDDTLKVPAAHFERGFLRAWNQKAKKSQTLPLHADTVAAIEATNPYERELLFPWPFGCKNVILKRLRVILKTAGLPTTSRDLFHKFRRTNATQLAIATDVGTVQRQMGHSAPSVTARYIDTSQFTEVNAAELIARPKLDGR